ncbi:hypothetical protein CGC20_9395 [Leishmania donovani]|uniref:WASH1 WAHD domain-containing protein n=1 Tax=Leishmania donovani TaxID=5661 RepID=A0A504XA61_LEIDO|nr:hypothetical protein CGC20_9395 [Leishmania donovani]
MESSISGSGESSGSSKSRSSSVDSARAVAAARAYDTAAIAIIPGLVVPLTSASSKGGCAALASAVASLEALADTVDTVLDRLDKAATSQQRRLNGVQRRICICADFIDCLRGRRTSTLLESKPRYPQLVPFKPRSRGGGVRAKTVKSQRGAQDGANAAAIVISGVPSAVSTAHSHRFLRPRRSSPLPPRTIATAHRGFARCGGSDSNVSSPAPPVNAVAAMRLAESMPLETVILDGEESSAVAVGHGGRDEAAAGHLSVRGTLMNAASLQPSSSSALAWQPRCLPAVRGGQAMHNASEMPGTLSALVSYPAHRMAYRHLVVASSSNDGNAKGAIASVQHGTPIYRDPYSPTGLAATARSATRTWLHSTSTVDIQCDFTTPLQAQQYAFVPGGDAAAASSRALLRDMPRNLPLQHLASVRRWDQRGGDMQGRTGGSTGSEDDEDVEEHDENGGPRQQRRASRRGPRDFETIAPGQEQRQRRARRRHTVGDGSTASEGSDDDTEAAARAVNRRRESGRARPKQQQARDTSTQPTAAALSAPPAAPPSLAPPPPPGVTRSTTAPPPPPLPPTALLQGKPNPPMFPLGSGRYGAVSSQKSAVSALTSMLGERRRVLQGDDSSSTSSGSGTGNKYGGANRRQADSSDSSSSSAPPRANPTARGRMVGSAAPQMAGGSSSSSDDSG